MKIALIKLFFLLNIACYSQIDMESKVLINSFDKIELPLSIIHKNQAVRNNSNDNSIFNDSILLNRFNELMGKIKFNSQVDSILLGFNEASWHNIKAYLLTDSILVLFVTGVQNIFEYSTVIFTINLVTKNVVNFKEFASSTSNFNYFNYGKVLTKSKVNIKTIEVIKNIGNKNDGKFNCIIEDKNYIILRNDEFKLLGVENKILNKTNFEYGPCNFYFIKGLEDNLKTVPCLD